MLEAFEQAEQDPCTDPKWANEKLAQLRPLLLHWQHERLDKADQTLLIVVAGMDGVGKGTAVNRLNTWMDPRHVHTLAFGKQTEEEQMRPAMWRYWNALPAKGQTALVFGSWYGALMYELQRKHTDMAKVEQYAYLIQSFEAELACQGVQIVKLWFHSSAQAQAQRCQDLLANPDTAWRVSKADLKVQKKFDRIRQAAMQTIQRSHQPHAPWVMIPCADPATRDLSVAQAVLQAMQTPISSADVQPLPTRPWTMSPEKAHLAALKQPKKELDKSSYDQALAHWQGRISKAIRSKSFRPHSLVVMFEGEDAAGKGGVIKRLTAAMDVRNYDVFPISAPDANDLAHPYLWRFWRRLPRWQKVAIFDRSWYGRVLVERVEKLASVPAWQRAYQEINLFEAQMIANGTLVLKFWLSVSKQEQLRRFQEREASPLKTYKITDDDWRNRAKWTAYRRAAQDMFDQTNTKHAPWHLIASNDKRAARIQILTMIAHSLEALDPDNPALHDTLQEPASAHLISEQV